MHSRMNRLALAAAISWFIPQSLKLVMGPSLHLSLSHVKQLLGTQCGALKSLSLPPLGRYGAPPQTVVKVTVLLDPVTSAVALL